MVKPQAKDALPQKDNGLEWLCQETAVLSQAKAQDFPSKSGAVNMDQTSVGVGNVFVV